MRRGDDGGSCSSYHIVIVWTRAMVAADSRRSGLPTGHFRGHVARRDHRSARVPGRRGPGAAGLQTRGHKVRDGLLQVVADLLGVAVGG